MTNLGTIFDETIERNVEWQNLGDVTGLTFEEGETYTIQCLNNAIRIRENNIVDGGIKVFANTMFQFTSRGEDLYIKTRYGTVELVINN